MACTHVELVQDVDNGLALGQLDGSIGAISDDLDTQKKSTGPISRSLKCFFSSASPSNLDRVVPVTVMSSTYAGAMTRVPVSSSRKTKILLSDSIFLKPSSPHNSCQLLVPLKR